MNGWTTKQLVHFRRQAKRQIEEFWAQAEEIAPGVWAVNTNADASEGGTFHRDALIIVGPKE